MTLVLAILVLVKARIAKASGAFPQTPPGRLIAPLECSPAVLRPELLAPPLFQNPVSASGIIGIKWVKVKC